MREIILPEDIRIGEFHGKTSWVVRAIWEENAGWFHYEDGTTALYGVPRPAVYPDLVELAGGAGALAARAHVHAAAGRPLEALHLLDIALGVAPDHEAALTIKKAALEQLLARSGGTNLSETMWLKAEIADAEKRLLPPDPHFQEAQSWHAVLPIWSAWRRRAYIYCGRWCRRRSGL
ncbi:alkyl sulfatase dimerization domain-containing protein [Sphingobium scionense]